jgi:hypothetical protein
MKATSENNSRKSYPHYAHIFRTMEAQLNQSVRFRAKLVIFAQAGQADMAEGLAHAGGVHDASTVTH